MSHAFLAEAASRARRAPPVLSAEAIERLMAHPWPGNVRELRNVVQRAELLAVGGPITPEHLLLELSALGATPQAAAATTSTSSSPTIAPGSSLQDELRKLERECVVEALEKFGGHQGKAAAHLGISRRTMTNKLNELSIPRGRNAGKREDDS
jgi:DNA-binding NtrC family response regulator